MDNCKMPLLPIASEVFFLLGTLRIKLHFCIVDQQNK